MDRGLSRRRLLAALGAVGVSAAGAGLGTTARLSDYDGYSGGAAAGGVDIKLGYRATYGDEVVDAIPAGDQGNADGVDCDTPGLVDGDGVPVVDLADVKPGDCGRIAASIHVCENPARIWLAVDLLETAEGEHRPEEVLAGDGTAETGELQDLVTVTCWIDADRDGAVDADERVVYDGSLAGLATAAASGLPLAVDVDGTDCVEDDTVVGLAWCLPLDGPSHNRAITDAVAFGLRFGAVQCRHDDGRNPFDGNATAASVDGSPGGQVGPAA